MRRYNQLKKHLSLLLIGIISLVSATACTSGSAVQSEPVQVEIKTVQDPVYSGRATLIEAHVKQGSEAVKDAQEVKFEIKKKDHAKPESIVAAHWQDGVYRIKKLFPQDGTYEITAHVTARDSSVSPQKELVVGAGTVQ